MPVAVTCPICKKIFLVKPHRFRIGRGKYCSKKCADKSPCKSQCGREKAPLIDHSKPLPHIFKKGHTPWNKGFKNCFSEDILEKIKTARAKQIFLNSDTSIELKIKEQLDKLNILYEHPFPLSYFICDFRIKNTNIIIECDGDYFHSLPRNRRYDYLKNKYCRENGWNLIRLSEQQINNNIDECMNMIMGVVF